MPSGKAGLGGWYEKDPTKKRLFKKKFGRKPNKEEIKLLRKNQIDLGSTTGLAPLQPMTLQADLIDKRIITAGSITKFKKGKVA